MPDVVSQQLGRSPAVIHLALHVVPAPDSARENMVALGAGLDGRPAYVGTEWIGRASAPGQPRGDERVPLRLWSYFRGRRSDGPHPRLASRRRQPRAFHVLATLDDGGALTSEFYRQLTTNRFSTVEALRRAQLAMIAHGDWRADPRYWAAYFLIGYPDLP